MNILSKILIVMDTYEDLLEGEGDLPIEVEKTLRLLSGNKTDGQIHLLSCGYEKFLHDSYYSFGDEMRKLREAQCERLESKLEVVAEKARQRGFRVTTELVWAYPRYEQVVKKAIEISADLVVTHTRPVSKLSRAILSNDTWQLVRFCPCPLLLVKNSVWQQTPNIMAAVDPAHTRHKPLRLDNKIIDLATESAAMMGSELHVLHAYAEIGRPFALPENVLSAHKDAFDELLKSYSIPAEKRHLVDDSPVVALQRYERELDIGIVVMGAISRSRLQDALIGNTAEQVLDYLDSDVMIVKPQSIL